MSGHLLVDANDSSSFDFYVIKVIDDAADDKLLMALLIITLLLLLVWMSLPKVYIR